ncbi:hypothetical protein [Hymenobacter properus]|uniref:Uncharacterized protein n=1 Tax=Hymenobacter properus TaxID=2791026 RepID=A0A931FKR4_9BACT|nr:hypothetical protein [Hymenobacter properus]MBF9144207.1 hypothetical protein [Hymenobacter properus]MBR7723025.1 hypothetical protein [Microvirga sp. SRT04]
MSSLPAAPRFHVLDHGALFAAEQVWHTDAGAVETCRGTWDFAHVAGVLAPVAGQFPTVEGPTCALVWMGEHLHIRAEYARVLAAWRRYRRLHGGSSQSAPLLRWGAN